MHISNLKVRNFRAIENLELSFNKGLNVLIGENNSGKTAIIDLLRLIFDKVNYPHEIYWKESDFRVGSTDEIKPIEFEIKFKINNKNEKYWFNDLHIVEIDENNNMQDFLEIQGKITLINSNNSKKIKREFWGGKDFENKIPWEVWNSLNFTYLSPLRDVNRDLRPTDNNLLSKLFLNIADLWIELLNEGKDKIITHLKEMNFIDDFQDIDINFSTFEYGDIVKKLILQLPINLDDETNKINYFNLYQNGLGYNNLIYASTIFGDIIQRKEILKQDYNLLLIEEPEAHLHPQLESTFFRYLQKLDMNNEFQIIVSSHSPTITAKTKLDNVIVMKNINNTIYATSIKDTCLKNEDKIFLKKFLDVTKSQLFFSNGVILVEGITEALLLPIFAKMLGEEYDLEKNGIEVIVTGISFQRYSGLFNSDDPNKRLNFKCAVLTDDDGDKKGLSDSRLNNLNKLSKNNFKAFIGRNTFEWELFKNNLNSDIIPKIFDKVHPRIRNNLKSNGTKFTPEILVKKLKKTKSEFAYELSEFLEKNYKTTDFIIPEYIKEAIIFVVDNHDE